MVPLLVIVAWLPVTWVAAMALTASGGWTSLARVCRRGDEQPDIERRFRSMTVMAGWLPANYSRCVIIGANPAGLFLRVFPLFRPFHPPLFIPWAAIQTTARQTWLGKWVELRCDGVPGVTIRLPTKTAVELADAVGGGFVSASA